ncbi:transcription factor mef2A isoform X1 [Calliphora vicina]|uniref:transcription factor mef2A isoform X1 n=1 Tax=Calliphora vicina TaxID=7373 RepID=UPI00325A5533
MFKLKLQKFVVQLCLLAVGLHTALACRGKLLAAGITEEEKEIVLREHNRLRQTVATGRYPGQPGAENMREIVWDNELAQRAQQWAENCEFRHDPHRTINRFTMGQNMAIIWSTAPLEPDDGDFASRIQKWFDEVQKYQFGDAWSSKTGHYSQLVWGETSLVGCGFAEYKDTSKFNKLYVCNYGPGGNVVGLKPYEVGKPACSSYGMKPSSRYQGLCAAPDGSTGFSTNAIETYDNNNNNNKVTNNYDSYNTYNTQQQTTQFTTTTTNTQYKYNNHNNNNKNNNNNNSKNENKFSNDYQHYQQASHKVRQTQQQTTSSATKKISTYGGYSFGTKNFGGSQTFTTETSQQYNKYRNKLEAYKPSPEEFKRSVFKHTVLRSSVDQEQPSSDDQQQQENVYNTPSPAKRGWSLLTWRG